MAELLNNVDLAGLCAGCVFGKLRLLPSAAVVLASILCRMGMVVNRTAGRHEVAALPGLSAFEGEPEYDDVDIKPFPFSHPERHRTPLDRKIGIILSLDTQYIVNYRHLIYRYCGVNGPVK